MEGRRIKKEVIVKKIAVEVDIKKIRKTKWKG